MGVQSGGLKSGIIDESFEIIKDTAKKGGAIPKQVVDEAKKHLTSIPKDEGVEQQQAGGQGQQGQDEQTASPKQIGAKRLSILQKGDDLKKQTALSGVRQKIVRYQQMQQQIQMIRKKREEEVPAYVAGKPGEVRTVQEKEARIKEIEAKKEEEEKKKKKEELLSPAAKAKVGTKERVKVLVG